MHLRFAEECASIVSYPFSLKFDYIILHYALSQLREESSHPNPMELQMRATAALTLHSPAAWVNYEPKGI